MSTGKTSHFHHAGKSGTAKNAVFMRKISFSPATMRTKVYILYIVD